MDIQDKIRKLLALANNKGATEGEAASAMAMATALMAKHNIDHIADKTPVHVDSCRGFSCPGYSMAARAYRLQLETGNVPRKEDEKP